MKEIKTGQSILIIGESGTGKTSSLESVKEKDKTFIISPISKTLPWKGGSDQFKIGKNRSIQKRLEGYVSDMLEVIRIEKAKPGSIKTVIMEDVYYALSNELNSRTESGFGKYIDVGNLGFKIAQRMDALNELGVNVFIFGHPDYQKNSEDELVVRLKTSSRFIDEKIKFEGLVNTVIGSRVRMEGDDEVYEFIVRKTEGHTYVKTLRGMFDEPLIPNELQIILDKIDEY